MKNILLVCCLLLFASIIITFPAILTPHTRLVGAGGDTYQYLGFQSLTGIHLKESLWPFHFTTLWRYPDGFDFSRGYDSVLSNFVGGILGLALGNITIAYNLTVTLSFVFNGVCAFLLCFQLTKSRQWSILGAFIFAFSFYNLSRGLGHMNLLLTGGFALTSYAVIRLLEQQNRKNWLILGFALGIVGLCSAQYFVMTAIVGLLFIFLASIFFPQKALHFLKQSIINIKDLSLGMLFPVCVALIVFMPLFMAVKEGGFVWRTNDDFSPHIIDFFAPKKILGTWGSWFNWATPQQDDIERMVFLGWTEWILFITVCIAGFKLLKNAEKKVVTFLLLFVFVLGLFCLGTINPETGIHLPYFWLVKVYLFAAVSEPTRFIVWIHVFLLIISCLMIRNIRISKNSQKNVFILILCALWLERLIPTGYPTVAALGGTYTKIVREQPGKAVLDIPIFDERYNSNPVLYNKAIVGGYMHWLGDTWQTREFIMQDAQLTRYICNPNEVLPDLYEPTRKALEQQQDTAMWRRLKEAGVNTIVVNKDYRLYWPECKNVLQYHTFTFPHLTLAKESALQTEEALYHWAGSTMDTGLFFQREGSIQIEKIIFYPAVKKEDVQFTVDSNPIYFENWEYTWKPHTPDAQKFPDNPLYWEVWLQPKSLEQAKVTVWPGSNITLSHENNVEDGYATISYKYFVNQSNADTRNLEQGGLIKIFEDTDKAVYSLR